MGEEEQKEEVKIEVPEALPAVIEDMEFREGRWWYYVRYEDGTTEWVEEERLIRPKAEEAKEIKAKLGVPERPPEVPKPPQITVGTKVKLTTDEVGTIILEHLEPDKYDIQIEETGEIRTITKKDIIGVIG